jgi:putative dimethyl sulfoxide reductase chaperone
MSDTLTAPVSFTADPTQLAGHALVLNLLGKLFYEPPEAAWLQSLAADSVFDEIPVSTDRPAVAEGLRLLQQWTRDYQAGLPTAAFEAVRADQLRLFVGPGPALAAPWESVQRDDEHMLFQQETLQVRNWYRRFGLQVVRLHQEPDDHAGLELAFLSHLAQLALVAQSEHQPERETELLTALRTFLNTHAQRWIPGWCAQVIQHARTDFYRGLAYVTVGVLAELADELQSLIPLEPAR